MFAVEFDTVSEGNTIRIPKEYKEFVSKNIRVILMLDEKKITRKQRKPGSAKGKFFMSDDFEQPLDDEIVDQFYQ